MVMRAEHGSGLGLDDQCGSANKITWVELRAFKHPRGDTLVQGRVVHLPHNPSHSSVSVSDDLDQRWRLLERRHPNCPTDRFDSQIVDGSSKELQVRLSELASQQFGGELVELTVVEADRDLPALPRITHRHLAFDDGFCFARRIGRGADSHKRLGFGCQLGEHCVGSDVVEVVGGRVEAANRLVGERSAEKPNGRSDTGATRNDQFIKA